MRPISLFRHAHIAIWFSIRDAPQSFLVGRCFSLRAEFGECGDCFDCDTLHLLFMYTDRSIAILDHVSKLGHNVYLSRHIRCGKTVFGLRSITWTLRCDSSVRIMFLALSALFHRIYRFVCVSVQAESATATATNKYAQLNFVISDAIIHTRCHTHTRTHTRTHIIRWRERD